MFDDYGFEKKVINKDEIQTLCKLVNFKIMNKFEPRALEYSGFKEWIMQISIYIYSKPGPTDLSAFPALKMLETFVAKMKSEAIAKNQNTILFDDPDAVSISDPDLLIALNKKLEQDPEYPVPEGFTKRKEKTIVYSYGAPTYCNLSEAQTTAIEILDELLLAKFGFHFLEPICTFEEKTKIRPVIHKSFDQTAASGGETPSYLQSLDK